MKGIDKKNQVEYGPNGSLRQQCVAAEWGGFRGGRRKLGRNKQ